NVREKSLLFRSDPFETGAQQSRKRAFNLVSFEKTNLGGVGVFGHRLKGGTPIGQVLSHRQSFAWDSDGLQRLVESFRPLRTPPLRPAIAPRQLFTEVPTEILQCEAVLKLVGHPAGRFFAGD